MNGKQLRQLTAVTATALSAAQAAMLQINQSEIDLREQLRDLKDRKAGQLADSAATRAGADVRWNRWADKLREDINAELARVLVEKERVRGKLRVAFGKDQAMQRLSEKIDAELRSQRKSQY